MIDAGKTTSRCIVWDPRQERTNTNPCKLARGTEGNERNNEKRTSCSQFAFFFFLFFVVVYRHLFMVTPCAVLVFFLYTGVFYPRSCTASVVSGETTKNVRWRTVIRDDHETQNEVRLSSKKSFTLTKLCNTRREVNYFSLEGETTNNVALLSNKCLRYQRCGINDVVHHRKLLVNYAMCI
jgi:hypothetical protein